MEDDINNDSGGITYMSELPPPFCFAFEKAKRNSGGNSHSNLRFRQKNWRTRQSFMASTSVP